MLNFVKKLKHRTHGVWTPKKPPKIDKKCEKNAKKRGGKNASLGRRWHMGKIDKKGCTLTLIFPELSLKGDTPLLRPIEGHIL